MIESNGFTADDKGFICSYANLNDYNTGEAGDIYIHYINGTMTRLTKTTDVDEDPSLSPDGRKVTWKHCSKYPCEDDEVYLMDVNGEKK